MINSELIFTKITLYDTNLKFNYDLVLGFEVTNKCGKEVDL